MNTLQRLSDCNILNTSVGTTLIKYNLWSYNGERNGKGEIVSLLN